MGSQHYFSLQRYGGSKTRHTCPNCGRPRCFTLYVDENLVPLNEKVGMCDHISSCGYHYPPKEYFKDHPLQKDANWDYQGNKQPYVRPQHAEKLVVNTLPFSYLRRSVKPDVDSALTTFLRTCIPDAIVDSLVTQYHIGVTKAGDTIFFQVDINNYLRTGKVMKYNPNTGRRIKDEMVGGRITWIHSLLKHQGVISQDWQCSQCLFGEHLLARDKDKPVALVESEKTALICAALMPKYIWLATGGKSQMNSRLNVLKGRTVIAFPDSDGYNEWREAVLKFPDLDIKVSEHLETTSTEEERNAQIDIADRLIKYIQQFSFPEAQLNNPVLCQIARYISPQYLTEVAALIEDLNLELTGIQKLM